MGTIGLIKSLRPSFYAIRPEDEDKYSVLEDPAKAWWVVSGAPCEKFVRATKPDGTPIGHGIYLGRTERNGFDYIRLRMVTGIGNFPKSYKGVSGGGGVIPYLVAEDERAEVGRPIRRLLLVGVGFYEDLENDASTIATFHGAKSIHDRVLTAARNHAWYGFQQGSTRRGLG